MHAPIVSVVVATYRRPESLRNLLADLSAQAMPSERFEVIVVDDGSPEQAIVAVAGATMPLHTRFIRIQNSGPGAARDTGALQAKGYIVVFLDDDMRIAPDFLSAHLGAHGAGAPGHVVLGNIRADSSLAEKPLFERFHARQIKRFKDGARSGALPLRGVHLCTGNVSMRLADYVAVGGFDRSLRRSEDRDLGIRLEALGCRFVFGTGAVATHGSDHHDVGAWRKRSEEWARADLQIARRHPNVADVHPWRFWSLIDRRARPLVALGMMLPTLGRLFGSMFYALARVAERRGREGQALQLTTLTYALDYFRGLRLEAGSLRALRAARQIQSQPAVAATQHSEGSIKGLRAAVRADHDQIRALRSKYHAQDVSRNAIGGHLVRKVGFQMLAVYRVMRWLRARRVPVLPAIISRVIRHLYSADIHWDARLAPGVAVVHGIGIVIGHGAVVGRGCVLFQGVTIGENFDAASGRIGAPILEEGVHVGPGAVLLGPIRIGAGSKISAGCVVTSDVPPNSLVQGAEVRVTSRSGRRATQLSPR